MLIIITIIIVIVIIIIIIIVINLYTAFDRDKNTSATCVVKKRRSVTFEFRE